MYNMNATSMKRNLTASMILLGVQLLLWKVIPTISYAPRKDVPIPKSSSISNILQTTLKGHALKVSAIAITTDNSTVISGSEDNTIKIWDARIGQLKRTLTGHTGVVNYLSVSHDGKYIVSAEDKSARIWNLLTGTLVREIQNLGSKISFVETSQDGQTLVIDGGTQIIKKTETKFDGSTSYPSVSEITKYIIAVYNLKTGTLKSQLAHDEILTQIKISPSGNILVSGEETGTLHIWDLKNGVLKRTLSGHGSKIQSIAISPDEKTIVSTDEDGQMKIWGFSFWKSQQYFQRT
jgi:WD40 repeat protein